MNFNGIILRSIEGFCQHKKTTVCLVICLEELNGKGGSSYVKLVEIQTVR